MNTQMKLPDYKAIAVEQGETPVTEAQKEYKRLLDGEDVSSAMSYAYSIYQNEYKSEVLEAFILAEGPVELISSTLRIPRDVCNIYQELFFDRDVFRDELDIEAYAQTYPDKWGNEIKVCAVTLGLDYLVFRFSRNKNEMDIASALKSVIENAYMLSKATRLNPLDSTAAREARQWAQVAIKGMEAYVRVKPATEETGDQFFLVMEHIDRTTKAKKDEDFDEASVPKDDIVH